MRWHAGQRFAARRRPPQSPARTRSAPSVTAAEPRRAARRGGAFASALERKRGDAEAGAPRRCFGGRDGGMVSLRISGGASGQDDGGQRAVGGRRRRGAVDRILVGSGPDGAQARIRIGAGALAGTEIQLSSGAAGHVVEARLLTHAASSRQTLSVVMDEIRLRLRDRGIVLSTTAPGTRGRAARRRRGEPARRRGRRRAERTRRGQAGERAGVRPRRPVRASRARQARATRAALRACATLPERSGRWSCRRSDRRR